MNFYRSSVRGVIINLAVLFTFISIYCAIIPSGDLGIWDYDHFSTFEGSAYFFINWFVIFGVKQTELVLDLILARNLLELLLLQHY